MKFLPDQRVESTQGHTTHLSAHRIEPEERHGPSGRLHTSVKRKFRNLTAYIVLGMCVLTGALVANSTSASADVVASSGAWARSTVWCGYRGFNITETNNGFDYVQYYLYTENVGSGPLTPEWVPIYQGTVTFGSYAARGVISVWARYADRLPNGQWAYASEWVPTNQGYKCYVG